MPKKLTYEFVKSEIEKEGYILLSRQYEDSHTKLEFVCPKGHKHKAVWYSWQQGKRCPYCAGQGKPTIDEIRSSFAAEGYKLLSSVYINNKSKLAYICSAGHSHKITWSDWGGGYRCPYCNGRPIITIKAVRESMEKEGYTLLDDKYTNNKTKLLSKCPNNHVFSIRWNDWIKGYRCRKCSDIKHSGPGHPNWLGGKSYEPYCEAWKDVEYKQDIKDRDNNMCLNPCCTSKNPSDLTIHHIDYNKKNCKPANLITICRSCNSKANTNRGWHKAWYKTIINKRYYYRS